MSYRKEKLPHSNVYVRGLPHDVNEQVLAKLFQPYGTMQSVRVMVSRQKSAVFAFIRFSSVLEAEAAISSLNGAYFMGCTLEVRLADNDISRTNSSSKTHSTPSENVYCKNLPAGFGEQDLRLLFMPYGEVVSCRMLHNGNATGEGGDALVRLASVQHAMQVVEFMRGHRVSGSRHPLVIGYANSSDAKAKKSAKKKGSTTDTSGSVNSASLQPLVASLAGMSGYRPLAPIAMPNSAQCDTSLYVANLPPTATKLFLYETFAPFGAVLSIKILTDDKGLSKGVAFVNFSDAYSAAAAVSALQNMAVGDRKLHVSFQTRKLPAELIKFVGPYFHI